MNNIPIENIVNKLEHSSRHAFNHYAGLASMEKDTGQHHDDPEAFIRKTVLKQGSTNFDCPHNNEEATYKVEAYIHCYVKMHHECNLIVFNTLSRKCNDITKSVRILFIDYGCGPMTSGLALLRCLGKRHAKKEIAYRGIDVSACMRHKCKQINNEYRLFSDAKFFANLDDVVEDVVLEPLSGSYTVIVNFSYVLSQWTHKGDFSVQPLVNLAYAVFGQIQSSLYVVYHNPVGVEPHESQHEKLHGIWKVMKKQLRQRLICDEIAESVLGHETSGQVFYCALRLTSFQI